MRLLYYLKIWIYLTKISFLSVINQRGSIIIFLFGKVLRFTFFYLFIYFLIDGVGNLASYNKNEVLFFLLTFNLLDVFTQLIYRDVYRFRPLVVSGGFDLVLTKPISSLFRSMFGGADVIDFLTLPPLMIITALVGVTLEPTTSEIILYLLLLANGFLIATAFHISVLALGIITLEIDHVIMIYRDTVALGRLPIDIYKEPLKGILTFIIPVALMVSVPAKVLMGLSSPDTLLIALLFGVIFFVSSLQLWKFALKYYTSASS